MAGTKGQYSRPSRRSPFVIDVARLGRRPGSMQELRETLPAPTRIGLDLVAIEEGAPVELELRLEAVSEGVLVTGTVSGPTVGDCARCLAPVAGMVEIDLVELFAYPDSTTEATTEPDEVGRVGSSGFADTVDLEQPIVDAVGLALPFAPLCTEDCLGLCPDCGTRLADAEPDHHHDTIDPRWAKLTAMLRPESDASGADGDRA